VSTDLAVFGGRQIRLPDGWSRQTLISIIGGAKIDATATPAENASLTLVTVLGGAEVVVPAGARVTSGGLAFLGGRKIDVTSRPDGPEIRVRAYSILGGINISDHPSG
jgi:hypothetical protein